MPRAMAELGWMLLVLPLCALSMEAFPEEKSATLSRTVSGGSHRSITSSRDNMLVGEPIHTPPGENVYESWDPWSFLANSFCRQSNDVNTNWGVTVMPTYKQRIVSQAHFDPSNTYSHHFIHVLEAHEPDPDLSLRLHQLQARQQNTFHGPEIKGASHDVTVFFPPHSPWKVYTRQQSRKDYERGVIPAQIVKIKEPPMMPNDKYHDLPTGMMSRRQLRGSRGTSSIPRTGSKPDLQHSGSGQPPSSHSSKERPVETQLGDMSLGDKSLSREMSSQPRSSSSQGQGQDRRYRSSGSRGQPQADIGSRHGSKRSQLPDVHEDPGHVSDAHSSSGSSKGRLQQQSRDNRARQPSSRRYEGHDDRRQGAMKAPSQISSPQYPPPSGKARSKDSDDRKARNREAEATAREARSLVKAQAESRTRDGRHMDVLNTAHANTIQKVEDSSHIKPSWHPPDPVHPLDTQHMRQYDDIDHYVRTRGRSASPPKKTGQRGR